MAAEGRDVLAQISVGRDERQEAARRSEAALEAAERTNDADLIAASLHTLGSVYRFLAPSRAREAFSRAGQLFREVGNRRGEGRSLHALGVLADETGDGEAEELFRSALQLARESGSLRLEANALDSLAILVGTRGDLRQAVDLLNEALELHRVTGNRRGMILSFNNLGDTHHELDELGPAEAAFSAGEALCLEIEAPNPCALLAWNYAELLLLEGRLKAAVPLIDRAEAFYGADDPDLLVHRSLQSYWEGDAVLSRERLEQAIRKAPPERGAAYRRAWAEVEARSQEQPGAEGRP